MKILNIFDNFTPFEIFLVGTSIVAAISLFFLIKKKIKQRKERKKFDSLLASKEGYNEDYKNFIQEIERVIPDWEKHKLIHSLNKEFKKLLIIKNDLNNMNLNGNLKKIKKNIRKSKKKANDIYNTINFVITFSDVLREHKESELEVKFWSLLKTTLREKFKNEFNEINKKIDLLEEIYKLKGDKNGK